MQTFFIGLLLTAMAQSVPLIWAGKPLPCAPRPQGAQSAPATGAAGRLTISPASIIVQVGESQVFHLLDGQKQPVRDAAWSISDTSLAEIHSSGDTATVSGLAHGRVILTATWQGLSAQARITFIGELSSPVSAATENSDWVRIEPDRITTLVGESHDLRLVDELARPIPDAQWSVSIPILARITSGPDATLQPLAPGSVTVTAESRGRIAHAEITTLAGSQLPVGTVKWSLKELPGFTTMKIVPAVPSASGVDVFVTEVDGCGRTFVRAVLPEGIELWRKLTAWGTVKPQPENLPGSTAFRDACTLPPPKKEGRN
jgi:hypothetical protein